MPCRYVCGREDPKFLTPRRKDANARGVIAKAGGVGRVMLQHDRYIHMRDSDVQEPSRHCGPFHASESSWHSAGPWLRYIREESRKPRM